MVHNVVFCETAQQFKTVFWELTDMLFPIQIGIK